MEQIGRLASFCKQTIMVLCISALLDNNIAVSASKTTVAEPEPEIMMNKGPSDSEQISLSKSDLYRWPDVGYRQVDSKMKTVTLRYGRKKDSAVVTKLQYWLREKFNRKTNATYYELHGKCIFENVDVTGFTDKDALECKIGLQRDKGRDWANIKMPFKAGSASVDDQVSDWSCEDAFQTPNYYGEKPNPIETDKGGYQNCYIYRNGSNVNASNTQAAPSSGRLLEDDDSQTQNSGPSTNGQPASGSKADQGSNANPTKSQTPPSVAAGPAFNGNLANYYVHFMRPLNTYDLEEDQDIYINLGKHVSAQLLFTWKGEERVTGTTLEIDDMGTDAAYRVITGVVSIATASLLYLI